MRTLALSLLLSVLTPAAALATPISLEILNGRTGAFGYSAWHNMTGPNWMQYDLMGTLDATLSGGSITGIHGTITFPITDFPDEMLAALMGGGSLDVLDGELHFQGDGDVLQPADSFLAFSNGLTVYFNDEPTALPANSFDGTTAYAWGSGWLHHVNLGMDLALRVRPVPEPNSALLFIAGALLVGGAARRIEA